MTLPGRMTTVSFLLAASVLAVAGAASDPPHIVFVIADDLGWNDIGFNNPDIISPNLDRLAREGIILDQSYVNPLCTPSRAALMTGEYAFRIGMQHLVILADYPDCVPLSRTFLPEVLKARNYATHIVGKWHLGYCDWKCTPTERGFDSFYGFYGGGEDYYNKTFEGGYDFRENKAVGSSANGTYSAYQYTERARQIIRDHDPSRPLFLLLAFQNVHSPLTVPQNYSNLYPEIKDEERKTFSGMVTALDDAVAAVVESLKSEGLYNNTLLVFISDNGGSIQAGGNNYPLRGGKFTLFEGGTRAINFVHGPMFNHTGVKYHGLMHMVDWYPTLAEAAGAEYEAEGQDGVSQWQSLLSLTTPSKRQEILYNLDLSDDPIGGRAAIRVGDYKLVSGFPGLFPDWYPPPSASGDRPRADRVQSRTRGFNWDEGSQKFLHWIPASRKLLSQPFESNGPAHQFLFNLKDDPEERHNIYGYHPDVVKELQARLEAAYSAGYAPRRYGPAVPAADPANYGGVWAPGWCPDVQ